MGHLLPVEGVLQQGKLPLCWVKHLEKFAQLNPMWQTERKGYLYTGHTVLVCSWYSEMKSYTSWREEFAHWVEMASAASSCTWSSGESESIGMMGQNPLPQDGCLSTTRAAPAPDRNGQGPTTSICPSCIDSKAPYFSFWAALNKI